MVDDVAQLERSNNKCYALAFRCIYIYIYKYRLEISHDILKNISSQNRPNYILYTILNRTVPQTVHPNDP